MSLLVVLKSLSILVLILLLIYFCYLIAKQRLKAAPQKSNKIKVIEQKQIDQKTVVTLLKIANKEFILATGQSALLLKEVCSSLEQEEINGSCTPIQKELHYSVYRKNRL